MSKPRKGDRSSPDLSGGMRPRLTAGVIAGVLVILGALVAWSIHRSGRDATPHRAPAAHASAEVTRPTPRATRAVSLLGGKLVFRDVAIESREFLGYHSSIHLTAAQEAIKREVLAAMPAACCSDSNAYTCCCACNLSKTVWGLSNYVLTRHAASADELRQVVDAWRAHTNPGGYSGSSCYTGGCTLPFHENGCGGMSEADLVL